MKAVRMWAFISVTVIALTAGRGSLRAQPAGDAVTVEGDDKPWNQGVPLDKRLAAVAMFKEGNRRFYMPLFAQAAEQYEAALRLWQHPAFYFNLAWAELNLGQDVEARDSLEQAIAHGLATFDVGDFQEAQKQRQELELKLGRLLVTCKTEGAEVALNGVALFTGPGSREVWAKAQAHEITAKKPNYLSEAHRVKLSHGERKALELRLITLSEAEDSSRRWSTWKPWSVVAAGALLGGGAVAFQSRVSQKFSNYDSQFAGLPCAQGMHPTGCPASDPAIPMLSKLNAQLRTARREQAVVLGGYIVGGSLLVTGVILLYLNRTQLTEHTAATLSFNKVTMTPLLSTDIIGVNLNINR